MISIKDIPNILTKFRLYSVPVMFLCSTSDKLFISRTIVFVIYALSALTDFFDGYIARKFNVISNFGKCFDPLADKLLVIVSLIILIHTEKINITIATILIFREILISGIREFAGGKEIKIPVSNIAKVKTALQLVGIGLLLLYSSNLFLIVSGNIILGLAAFCSLYTAYQYISATSELFK